MFTKKDNTKNEAKNSKLTKNDSSTSHKPENHSCCQPQPTKTMTPSTTTQPLSSQPVKQQYDPYSPRKDSAKTKVTIKYNVGFPNQLYIRGKGANLNWDKGQPLKNIKADEWVWETDGHFTQCEFKVLINDHIYETGDNHLLHAGATLLYTPQF